MSIKNCLTHILISCIGIGLIFVALGDEVYAHCDTLDGPVVQTARIALESYKKVVELEPSNEEIWLDYSHIYAVQKDFEGSFYV